MKILFTWLLDEIPDEYHEKRIGNFWKPEIYDDQMMKIIPYK